MGKKSKNFSKVEFSGFCLAKNLNHWYIFLPKKWCIGMFFMILRKTRISGKNLVLQWWFKMLLTNQLAGFFDHQYVGKESIDILVFLHVVSYQWKIASETTTFSWVWPVVSLIQSNCRILWSLLSLERTNWYHSFFPWRWESSEGSIWDGRALVECGQLCLLSNKIPGFCGYHYLWRNQLTSVMFCLEMFI